MLLRVCNRKRQPRQIASGFSDTQRESALKGMILLLDSSHTVVQARRTWRYMRARYVRGLRRVAQLPDWQRSTEAPLSAYVFI